MKPALIFLFAALLSTSITGSAKSDPLSDPVAIYNEDCGPDDGIVTQITIPESRIDNEFCRSVSMGDAAQNSNGIFASSEFHITAHMSTKLWDGEKIGGEILQKFVWVDMCGYLSTAIDKNKFQLLSLQYLPDTRKLKLQYRIDDQTITRSLSMQHSGKKEHLLYG